MSHTLVCVMGLILLHTLIYCEHTKAPNRAFVTIQPYWTPMFIGEEFTVRCEIQGSGVTEWEYEWRRPGSTSLSKHSEHRISGATEYHSGNYMCRGTKGLYLSAEWSKVVTLTVSPRRPQTHISADKRGLSLGDSTVTLTCSVNPLSLGWKYYWYRDDKTSKHLTKDAVFHSNGQITVSKGGYYWCRGGRGNPLYYTEFSDPINIDIIVTYRAVVQPNWPELHMGETMILRCEIRERRDIDWEYEWLTTSSNKPPNLHEYRIRNVSSSHSGDYSCKGRLKNGLHYSTEWSDSIKVTVLYQPKPVLTVSPLWLNSEASVTLSCEFEHRSAGWRFYWYKTVPDPLNSYSYELLPSSSNGTEQNFYIIYGQRKTAGYVCRAGRENPVYYTQYSEQKFVWSGEVLSQAFLSVSPDRVQHFTNESGSLSCEGNSTEWRIRFSAEDGQLLHCSDWNTINGSTCNIDSLRHRKAVYWCESGSGEFSCAVNITIQNEHIILLSPVHPVPEGESVTLGCKLQDETIVSNVIFYQNDKVIQNDTRSELNISSVSHSDEGFYKCQYSGSESPQSWMTVKYDIILVISVSPVTEGDSVTLICQLNTGELLSNVTFYQNDKIIQNHTIGEVTLSEVSKSDEGFYKCIYSEKESRRTWMGVKLLTVPKLDKSFPTGLVIGLNCGVLVIIVSLLLVCRLQKIKNLCCNRSLQSQSTKQGSATDHRVDQDESQIYSSLVHGDVCIYESIRRPESKGIDDSAGDHCHVASAQIHLQDLDNDSADDTDTENDYCNVNAFSTTGLERE